MKPFVIMCAAIAPFLLPSCGTHKAASPGDGDYQYQMWLAQQRAAQQNGSRQVEPVAQPVEQPSSRPKRKLREEDPTVELALQETPNLRSWGEATGFVESAVMDNAIMIAQERMSNLLSSSIETAAKNYARNANVNLDNTGATLFESMSKRLSVTTSKNMRILKRSVYDLENGQVQIYVCIESKTSKEQLTGQLTNELSREGFLRTKADQAKFEQEMSSALSDYKKSLEQNSDAAE